MGRWRGKLLDGLLGSCIIGFQTGTDRDIKQARALFLKLRPADRKAALAVAGRVGSSLVGDAFFINARTDLFLKTQTYDDVLIDQVIEAKKALDTIIMAALIADASYSSADRELKAAQAELSAMNGLCTQVTAFLDKASLRQRLTKLSSAGFDGITTFNPGACTNHDSRL